MLNVYLLLSLGFILISILLEEFEYFLDYYYIFRIQDNIFNISVNKLICELFKRFASRIIDFYDT